MDVLKNIFLLKKDHKVYKSFSHEVVDQYIEIAKLVKEARIQQKLNWRDNILNCTFCNIQRAKCIFY